MLNHKHTCSNHNPLEECVRVLLKKNRFLFTLVKYIHHVWYQTITPLVIKCMQDEFNVRDFILITKSLMTTICYIKHLFIQLIFDLLMNSYNSKRIIELWSFNEHIYFSYFILKPCVERYTSPSCVVITNVVRFVHQPVSVWLHYT